MLESGEGGLAQILAHTALASLASGRSVTTDERLYQTTVDRIQSLRDQLGQRQTGCQARRLDSQQGDQPRHPMLALVLDDEIPGRFPRRGQLGTHPGVGRLQPGGINRWPVGT